MSYYAPDQDAFVEYVRGVVTRYRRYIHHWELWNEPDHPLFWRPAPDAAAYADGGLLPGPEATLAGPTYEEWSNSEARSRA